MGSPNEQRRRGRIRAPRNGSEVAGQLALGLIWAPTLDDPVEWTIEPSRARDVAVVAPPGSGFAATRHQVFDPDAADGDELMRRVSGFHPKDVPGDAWLEIGDFVRTTVEHACRTVTYKPPLLLNVVTQLAYDCWIRGVPMVPEAVLHPAEVESFCVRSDANYGSGTAANFRSMLRRVGEAVVGPPLWSVPEALGTSPAMAGYTAVDQRRLVGWVNGRPTPSMRNNLLALTAGPLGAGTAAREINVAVGTDVETTCDGTVLHITGERARSVVVRADWEEAFLYLADLVGSRPLFPPDRARASTKDVANYIERFEPPPGTPKFSVQRCRTTWIVQLLNENVPARLVAEMAGLGPDGIGRYIAFTKPTDPADVARLLRGPT